MSKVYLTNHAYNRMKERTGISKRAADRLGRKAYEDGIGREEVKGSLYRYITSSVRNHNRDGADVKIYGEMVYCFLNQSNGVILLTVFGLPNDLKNQALGVQKRKTA
jgi:hypothetical protein